MGWQNSPRAIAPKPGDSIFRTDIGPTPRIRKSSTACLECRNRKRRCDGISPCNPCRLTGQDCVIDGETDGRRKILLKRKIDSLEQDNKLFLGLVEELRYIDEERALQCFRMIRSNMPLESIYQHLTTSPDARPQGKVLASIEVFCADSQTSDREKIISRTMDLAQSTENPCLKAPAQRGISTPDNNRVICLDDIETNDRQRIFMRDKLRALKDTVNDILETLESKEKSQKLLAAAKMNAFSEQIRHILARDLGFCKPSETTANWKDKQLEPQHAARSSRSNPLGIMDIEYLTSEH